MPLSATSLIDLGSNVDCRPGQMLGFAAIGVAFARKIQGIKEPRVALLSVGSEEGKGNRQVREAYPIFQESGLNFVGNVEGLDLFLDKADVVVCDGFVGNVLLKFAEGMSGAIGRWLPGALKAHLPPSVAGSIEGLVEGAIDLTEVGGGPLFGVKGNVVIGHGRARAAGIAGAIKMARRVWEADLVEAMQNELNSLRSPVKE
jgi:glycerol-3-phosphate acyltransferase PlsX